MTKQPPSRSLDKFLVRLPPGMKDQLEQAAKLAGRSMTAEITHRLERSFELLEGELLGRRQEEAARLTLELSRLGHEIVSLQGQLFSRKNALGIPNPSSDPEVRRLEDQLERAIARESDLQALYARYEPEVSFLKERVRELLGSSQSQTKKPKSRSA